jgi:DNA-binding beta-propeller fold protein YncE
MLAFALLLQVQASAPAPAAALPTMTVYVASEAVDNVSKVEFGSAGPRVVKVIPVDPRRSENDGPHNLNVSPDRKYWYVDVAHGTPNGSLWQFDLAADTLVGRTTLSRFPATMHFSPDGEFVWVANFNLYGDMVPSSVSVVYTPAMSEVARIPTCLMPHGLRLLPDGSRVYMTCMMDDKVVEIDPQSYQVLRVSVVKPGSERVVTTADPMFDRDAHAGHAAMSHDGPDQAQSCAPTWIQPSPNGQRLFVACNRHSEVLELDQATLRVTRRFATGRAPYNLAVTPDGKLLVATLKGVNALSVIDLATGREVVQLPTSHTVPSGVQVTPDGRYAVVSQEGKGGEAGALDLFDLTTRQRVASIEVGAGAGGVQISAYGR